MTTALMTAITIASMGIETAIARIRDASVPVVCLKTSWSFSFEYVMSVVLAASVAGGDAVRCSCGVEKKEEELYSFMCEWWSRVIVTGQGMLVEVLVVGLMEVNCCVVDTAALVLCPGLVVGVFVHSHPVTV